MPVSSLHFLLQEPPDYLVLEPEDTTQRTANLQQINTSGYKFQGSDKDFDEAEKIVQSWGTDGRIYKPTQEYQEILSLIGLDSSSEDTIDNILNNSFAESQESEGLLELVREWYRLWLQDPNLQEKDLYLIPEEWERKINLLKKRTYRLYQKITNPQFEETRLDDYVLELNNWFKTRFKERKRWQEPQIWVTALNHDEGFLYYEFQINFFVDDIKLEYGKRGDRISSQIYQEILRNINS